MRGEDDRVPVAVQLPDEGPQALPQLDIDAGSRLIQHDHRWLVDQRLTDEYAALHAAGERAHVGVGACGEVEVMQDLVDPGVVVADAEITGLYLERLAHRKERIENQLLRYDAQEPP